MRMRKIILSGDSVDQGGDVKVQADQLLSEMGQLYRERFQALQSNDQGMIGLINHQISGLRSRLERL
jgi:hypothetical protein